MCKTSASCGVPTPTSTITPIPTNTPTPTSIPTPTNTPTPAVGTIEGYVFRDRNGDGLQDPDPSKNEGCYEGTVTIVIETITGPAYTDSVSPTFNASFCHYTFTNVPTGRKYKITVQPQTGFSITGWNDGGGQGYVYPDGCASLDPLDPCAPTHI